MKKYLLSLVLLLCVTFLYSGERGKVMLIDETGNIIADFITTNGFNGLVAIAPGHVSSDNSTGSPLLADAVFTGEWELITNFGVIVLSVTSNVASAVDGLEVQFSSNATAGGILSDDNFTVAAGAKKTFSFQAAAKYYRVVYTNGGTNQTSFSLQAILKPYYVKPSSHRIQDSIVDDDDAELIKSVLSGSSSLTDDFENVTTYRGALDVNSAWLHRKIVNETFHQDTSTTTTLNSAASEGDTSISVADTADFLVGDEFQIVESTIQEIGLITITAVSAGTPGTLTLDRPLGNDYTTDAVVTEVNSNMAVVGTLGSPQSFEVTASSGAVWQLTRLLISMTSTTAMDDAKFGGISAITNGVSIRATTSAGRTVTFANWKQNYDLKLDMHDVEYSDKAPAGSNGLNGRWTFTKSEVVAELDGNAIPAQKMEILVQDDLTGLTTFKIRAQGRVFKP